MPSHSLISIGFLLALLPRLAMPSDGLKYAAAYMHDPQRVTEAMVEACVRKDPGLTDRLTSAFNSWVVRNQSEISRIKGQLDAELKKRSSSDADFRRLTESVDHLNNEAIAAMEGKGADLSFCGELLEGLESGKSDLKNFFPAK